MQKLVTINDKKKSCNIRITTDFDGPNINMYLPPALKKYLCTRDFTNQSL